MKNYIKSLYHRGHYNIGFMDLSSAGLIEREELPKINWLKHNYKDRFFADPFILDATESRIYCLVEELIYGSTGKIALLEIDRDSYRLIDRKIILDLDTHLSYPAIFTLGGKTYVYPENGQSGTLKSYLWNPEDKSLSLHKILANDDLIDSTITEYKKEYYLIGTRISCDCLKNAYLYKSSDIDGPYTPISPDPVISDPVTARPGGAFFRVGDTYYRPAQDCGKEYGVALHIMKINSFEPYREEKMFTITPRSFKYRLGLHTLNFHHDNLAVIDSRGYRHPYLGPIVYPCYHLIKRIIAKKKAQ